MERWDAIVVGAGPAGSLAARALGRAGWRCLLLEARSEPQRKACGEYLAPPGVAELASAGLLDAVLALGSHRLEGMRMQAPGACMRERFAPRYGLVPAHRFALGVRRERFDACLQEAAASHCRLQRGTRIAGIARGEDGRWQLRSAAGETWSASLLVGADGRQSPVRHAAGLHRVHARRRIGLASRAHGVDDLDHVGMHLGPLGQVAICPLGGGEANVNLLLAPCAIGWLRRLGAEALLRRAIHATPTAARVLAGARFDEVLASGPLAQASRAPCADGLVLVGDAAGFCDPFTGEGMSLALRSARLLGEALPGLDPGRVPSRRDLAPYAAAFAAGIGRRRMLGEALQPILARRSLAEHVVGALARLPLAARLMSAGPMGARLG